MRTALSRYSVVVCLVGAGLALAISGSGCWAQTPPSLPSSPPAPLNNSMPKAIPGGGVIADFDTLMNLIQQTIDPDSWLQAGGTNTISPYPAGVYVDPKGYMKRLKDNGDLPADLRLAAPERAVHPWRKASKLRTVSLKKLDASLAAASGSGLQLALDLLKVAGLSRITYVKVMPTEEDILIAGPAGDSQQGFWLHDLATVASVINKQTSPLGCSIDPTNAGILDAQAMLQERGAIDRLARNPKLVVQQMQEKIGPHAVSVFGLPAHCSTALALVDADEHMKRVAFGTVPTAPRVKSYFDFLDEQADVPKQSMVRWWFAFSDESINVNGAAQTFQLPENCVCVLSEQQWVSQRGVRGPTGERDAVADKFASEISAKIPLLRKTIPSYARLCGVFESSLALQLALEMNGEPDLQAWFPNLCGFGKSLREPTTAAPARTVEGLTAWHRLKSGTTVAVVSGGVKLDLQSIADRSHWVEAKYLAASNVPSQAAVPTTAHAQWWWD